MCAIIASDADEDADDLADDLADENADADADLSALDPQWLERGKRPKLNLNMCITYLYKHIITK